MAEPTTKAEFKEYCLRKLGKPVIDINVSDDQVTDRVDEALAYYHDYHFDGVEKVYFKARVLNSYIEFSTLSEGDFKVGDVIKEVSSSSGGAETATAEATVVAVDVDNNRVFFKRPSLSEFTIGKFATSDTFASVHGANDARQITDLYRGLYETRYIDLSVKTKMTGTITITDTSASFATTGNVPEVGQLIRVSGVLTGGATLATGDYRVSTSSVGGGTFQLKNTDGSTETTVVGGGATTGLTFEIIEDPYIGVSNLFPMESEVSTGTGMFNAKYQFILHNLHDIVNYNITHYYMSMAHLDLLDEMLVGKQQLRFNRHTNKVYIDADWDDLTLGTYIVVEAYKTVDTTSGSDVWKDRFLQNYATAKIKYQWGSNLTKFNGMTLPGGVQFNGEQILSDAREEIQRLEEEMASSYSLPATDMIG